MASRGKSTGEQPSSLKRILPLAFLVFGEAMLAVNQTNISSIYYPISQEFNQSVYGLGILTAALFLSYCLFEVPGGILAIRTGPKRIAIIGFALNTLGVIMSAFSPHFSFLIFFRFISGIGSAFAFPTILVLIVRQLKEGSEGLGSGWTVGWTSVGAAIGLVAWPILAQFEGWRLSVFVAGLLDLVPLVAITVLVRSGDDISMSKSSSISYIRNVIFDKKLLLVGLVLFGAGEGFSVVSNFIVYYLEQFFKIDPGFAGLVAGLSSLVPIFISPQIGRLHDKVRRVRTYFLISGMALAVGIGLLSFHNLSIVIVASIAVGLATGVFFTLGFALAKSASRKEYETLGIAWVDSFSLLGGIVSPIFFSLLALNYGYSVAWMVAGVASFLPMIPLLVLSPRS